MKKERGPLLDAVVDTPMQVILRCPDCAHDFPIEGRLDRHAFYECPKCTYEFSLSNKRDIAH